MVARISAGAVRVDPADLTPGRLADHALLDLLAARLLAATAGRAGVPKHEWLVTGHLKRALLAGFEGGGAAPRRPDQPDRPD